MNGNDNVDETSSEISNENKTEKVQQRSVSFEDSQDITPNQNRTQKIISFQSSPQNSTNQIKSFDEESITKADNEKLSEESKNSFETTQQEDNASKDAQTKRDRIGSLRRNISIGNFRKMFRKQHSRSYSESPSSNSSRASVQNEDSFQFRAIKKSDSGTNSDIGLPASPEAESVVNKTKDDTKKLSSNRKVSTLPRMSQSTANNRQNPDHSSSEDKTKAVQIWQEKAIQNTSCFVVVV